MNEAVIIAPELNGGVGDHTRQLLKHLPPIKGLRVIVPKRGSRAPRFFEQYSVEETEERSRDIGNLLPDSGGKVLLQYSAYGYNQFGYPHWLIKGLRRWKDRSNGRLVIMFHETWTNWPMWNPNYVLQTLHRRDLRQIMQVADLLFTSTTSQAKHLQTLSRGGSISVLPVGSNIQKTADREEEKEKGLAVLFGLQAGRIRTLQKMENDLQRLAGASRIQRIVTAGSGGSPMGDKEEFALLLRIGLPRDFEQRGPLPEEKISELLSTAEFAISIQDELSITKSSTFMAFASHELNILSCFADEAKPEPISLLVSPKKLLGGITDFDLETRGQKLRQWQEKTSAWPGIATQIAQALGV